MTGFTVPSKGTTGVAPTTVYFGPVPDNFSAIVPGFTNNTGTFTVAGNGFSCKLVNKWTIYNQNQLGGGNVPTSSFGAFTTAPDATTNAAQKVVESSTNTIHGVVSGFPTANTPFNFGFKTRFSIFAKAVERTRFALYVGAGNFDADVSIGSGIKVIFDVGGGQIGVAPTTFGGDGATYSSAGTEIVSFGSGWYRCTFDVVMGKGAANNSYGYGIFLDSGSGTAAESTKYVGNGSSGMYFWKCTALPPGAWALNTVSFFDDFTSLSTIDMASSGAAGFNWYPQNHFPVPRYNALTPTNTAKLSIVSGTQLKIATSPGQADLVLMSIVSNGVGGYRLGRVFQPSGLFEARMSWDAFTNPTVTGTSTFWAVTAEWLQALSSTVTGGEIDFFENYAGGARVMATTLTTYNVSNADSTAAVGQVTATIGSPQWYNGFIYHDNVNDLIQTIYAENLGITYQSTLTQNQGNVPASNPGDWTVISPTVPPSPVANDFTQMTTFSTLWTKSSANDQGQILVFLNGNYCLASSLSSATASHFTYSPSMAVANNGEGAPDWAILDNSHWELNLGTNTAQNTFVDWVKVTQ